MTRDHHPVRPRSMNFPQRVVVVIALAVALLAIRSQVISPDIADGWFNYAPNSGLAVERFPDEGWSEDGVMVLTLLFTLGWAAFSVWLLRTRHENSPESD